jgi:uncharacterized protein (DUF2236 family)
MREMLHSRCIAVSARSRALAHAILFPPGWRLMWPPFRALQLITIGLLPPAIREGFGFKWTARDARALTRWTSALQRLHHAAPPFVREWPAARRRRRPRDPISLGFDWREPRHDDNITAVTVKN